MGLRAMKSPIRCLRIWKVPGIIEMWSHSGETGEVPKFPPQAIFEALLKQEVEAKVELPATWLHIKVNPTLTHPGPLEKD